MRPQLPSPSPPIRPALLVASSIAVLAALGVSATRAEAQERLTLGDAVEAALATHPAIRAAEARGSSARHRVREADASRWPSFGLEYSLTRFDEPMVTTPIHGFDPTSLPDFDRTLAQGRLGARYTLLDWGARGAGVDGATAGAEAADASARSTRMQLIEAVATAYLQLGAARAVDRAAEARVEATRSEVERVETALEAGTAAEVERLRASTALQDALARQVSTRAAVASAERDLARLTGVEPVRLGGSVLDEPASVDPPPSTGRPAAHPLVERAERAADAARTTVDVQRSSLLPRLDLTGAMLDFGTLSSPHVFEWQVGAQLSWTLFSGGGRRASVRRAEADLRAAEADVAMRALEVDAARDAARTAIESADARVAALETSVAQWEELLRVEQLALEAGAGTQRDLLEAQAGLFNARAGRSQAYADAAVARVRLAAADGSLTTEWIQGFTRSSP